MDEKFKCFFQMCKHKIYNESKFYKWIKKHHPDKGGNTKLFQEINNCRDLNIYCTNINSNEYRDILIAMNLLEDNIKINKIIINNLNDKLISLENNNDNKKEIKKFKKQLNVELKQEKKYNILLKKIYFIIQFIEKNIPKDQIYLFENIKKNISIPLKITENPHKTFNKILQTNNEKEIFIKSLNQNNVQENLKALLIENTNDDIKKSLIKILKIYNKIWRDQIQLEKNSGKNVPIAFSDIGRFGEFFCSFLSNSIGGGSKGGCAFDLIDLDDKKTLEVKTICLIQPKKCQTDRCNVKVPYFQEKCLYCNKNNFTYINDSRAGIDVKAHFEYDEMLKEYLFVILMYKNDKINIQVFRIDKQNCYFNKYLQNQYLNSKSNTANLLPFSYDFYCSAPQKLLEINLKENDYEWIFFNLENKQSEKIPMKNLFGKRIFTQSEIKYYAIATDAEYIDYNNIKDKLILRNKNLNKKRGHIVRKI